MSGGGRDFRGMSLVVGLRGRLLAAVCRQPPSGSYRPTEVDRARPSSGASFPPTEQQNSFGCPLGHPPSSWSPSSARLNCDPLYGATHCTHLRCDFKIPLYSVTHCAARPHGPTRASAQSGPRTARFCPASAPGGRRHVVRPRFCSSCHLKHHFLLIRFPGEPASCWALSISNTFFLFSPYVGSTISFQVFLNLFRMATLT